MAMGNQQKAYAYALATVGLWSTVASAFKLSLRHLQPAELLLYATAVSCCVLLTVILVQGRGKELAGIGSKDWLVSFRLGLLNPFLYYLVLFEAYDMLPAQQAQPINHTWAITLTLLSIPLLKQRIGRMQIMAICVSYSGVVVISTRGNLLAMQFDSPVGVGLALFSTLIWSIYWIYNARDRREPIIGLFLNFCCALPCIACYVLLVHGFRIIDPAGLLGAVYIGFFEMGIAYVFWLKAMKLSKDTARIANLIFICPFLSLVFIHFLVGEEILPSTFVGLVFIVAGLILQSSSGARKSAKRC